MPHLLPLPVEFEGEQKGEKVLFFLRAHFITNLSWILIVLLAAIIPLILFAIDIESLLNITFDPQLVFLFMVFYYIVIFGYAFQQFLHWFFNIHIATNKRVIDMDFYSLFYRHVSEATLENIEDISFSKGGIFQNFFDYGTIYIQTAGTTANFEFLHIPDPEGNQKQIVELITMAKKGELR